MIIGLDVSTSVIGYTFMDFDGNYIDTGYIELKKEKNMYGKTFMGIERTRFLIDGQGRIASVWRKVKVPGHVEDVLAAARAL